MEPSEQERDPVAKRCCVLCGREGTRGFMAVGPRVLARWICQSYAACERRVRGTAQVGVGAMRSYLR